MYGSECHVMDDVVGAPPPPPPPNGSKVVTLLFRLSTLVLALTSAVVMATASECTCTIHGAGAATATVVVFTFKDYQPFVYLVGSNIAATILEVAAIYLQVVNTGGGGGGVKVDAPPPPPPAAMMKNPRVVLVGVDVAVQMLLYSATGAVFAAGMAYADQMMSCEQVHRSKIISLAAGLSAGIAAIAKDVQLPCSVWPHV